MLKAKLNTKGVLMLVLLVTIFVVSVLVSVILTIILNQGKLAHHSISRTKAYYVGLAAMNLAREKIRTRVWGTTPAGQPYTLCSSGCTVNDSDIPYTVTITISDPTNGRRTITLRTTYPTE